jgi:hypothetical protein
MVAPVRNGRGIVALRDFPVGSVVCRIGGRIVDSSVLWRWWDRQPQRAANCLRFDEERYLEPGRGIGAFLNHSCRPNTLIERSGRFLVVRALRPIVAGQEVTNDYSTLIGPDDVWTMRCNCGERGCRRTIRRLDRLPAARLKSYRASGAIPAFLLQMLEDRRRGARRRSTPV